MDAETLWDSAIADASPANIAVAARELFVILVDMGEGKKASSVLRQHLKPASDWVVVGTDDLSFDDEANARTRGHDEAILQQQPFQHADVLKSNLSIVGTDEVSGAVQTLRSNLMSERVEAATRIRVILSTKRHPPIAQAIQHGAIPPLLESVQHDDQPKLQHEAAWALTNVAHGGSDAVKAILGHGALPMFVRLLSSHNSEVKYQAVLALGTIAGDNPHIRDQVLACGALPPLVSHLSGNLQTSMMRNATWALSNFVRGKPPPPTHIAAMALPALASLVHHDDTEVLTDALWALSSLADGENERIQAVLDAGVLPRVVRLLAHSSPQVQTPALRCVGNISTGTDAQTQAVLDLSALRPLHAMLSHPKKAIRKEACWTLSNLTAGTSRQIQAVLEAEGVVPALVELSCSADFEVRREAMWALSNPLETATPQQVALLVQQDCLRGFGTALGAGEPTVVLCALEGVGHVLDKGAELAKLNAALRPNAFHGYLNQLQLAEKITALMGHPHAEVEARAREAGERHRFVCNQ